MAEVGRAALHALDTSPSVRRWGPGVRRGFVDHHASLVADGRVVVAELDGDILGVGSVRPDIRHAHDFMRIEVIPGWRGRGVGSSIYENLIGREPGPFSVREMLTDHYSVDFYTNRGFVTGEVATEGRIDPARPETSMWLNVELERPRLGFEIVSVPGSGIDERALAMAMDDLYRWCHRYSPPVAISADRAVETYLGSWRRESGAVARIGGRIVGTAILNASPLRDDPRLAHLVWCGVRHPSEPRGAEVTRQLLAHCLGVARDMRWEVDVEVNHPHESLVAAVERVPGAALFQDLTILVSEYQG